MCIANQPSYQPAAPAAQAAASRTPDQSGLFAEAMLRAKGGGTSGNTVINPAPTAANTTTAKSALGTATGGSATALGSRTLGGM